MSLQVYLAYVAACIGLALLPGPIVTLVIANGLRHGTRAALTNIAGVQAAMTKAASRLCIRLPRHHGNPAMARAGPVNSRICMPVLARSTM